MKNIVWSALACALLAGCATQTQTAGTATGAVAGALVAGPVGAVAGGVAGAVLTRPGGALEPEMCYVRSRTGQILYDRAGRPRVRRC